MNIAIYTENPECLTFTFTNAIAKGNNNVHIINGKNKNESNNEYYLSNISKIKNVNVIKNLDGVKIDWLYIQDPLNIDFKKIDDYMKIPKNIGLINSYYLSNIKTLIKSNLKSLKYLKYFNKIKNIGFLEEIPDYSIFSFFGKNQYQIGFDVHSKFLCDKGLNKKMFNFNWKPKDKRKYLFNFIGNKKPFERERMIDKIKTILPKNIICKWVLVDDNDKKRGISGSEYIKILEDSDFTLCPPGYSNISHRVIEALCKGSIPILNEKEAKYYDINLKNGFNCIVVRKNNWQEAVNKAIKMNIKEKEKIRRNILEMKDNFLNEKINAKRLRNKMRLR